MPTKVRGLYPPQFGQGILDRLHKTLITLSVIFYSLLQQSPLVVFCLDLLQQLRFVFLYFSCDNTYPVFLFILDLNALTDCPGRYAEAGLGISGLR